MKIFYKTKIFEKKLLKFLVVSGNLKPRCYAEWRGVDADLRGIFGDTRIGLIFTDYSRNDKKLFKKIRDKSVISVQSVYLYSFMN